MAGKHIAPPPTFSGGKTKNSDQVNSTSETEPVLVEETPIAEEKFVEETTVEPDEVSEVSEPDVIKEAEIVSETNLESDISGPVIVPVEEASKLPNKTLGDEKSFDEIIEGDGTEPVVLTNDFKEDVPSKARVAGIIVFGGLFIVACAIGGYALEQSNILSNLF